MRRFGRRCVSAGPPSSFRYIFVVPSIATIPCPAEVSTKALPCVLRMKPLFAISLGQRYPEHDEIVQISVTGD
jgi:hypothetical protein